MGKSGIRRRKPRHRLPKGRPSSTPTLPPETEPNEVWLPYTGGPVLAGPGAWLRVLTYGTPAQRRRVWLVIGSACLALAAIVVLAVSL